MDIDQSWSFNWTSRKIKGTFLDPLESNRARDEVHSTSPVSAGGVIIICEILVAIDGLNIDA